jgi:hypothetical protein
MESKVHTHIDKLRTEFRIYSDDFQDWFCETVGTWQGELQVHIQTGYNFEIETVMAAFELDTIYV